MTQGTASSQEVQPQIYEILHQSRFMFRLPRLVVACPLPCLRVRECITGPPTSSGITMQMYGAAVVVYQL